MNKIYALSLGLFTLWLVSTPATSEEGNLFFGTLVVDTSYFDIVGQSKNNVTRGLLSVALETDFQGFTFYADAQLQRGRNGSDSVGDIQAFSNIDESDFEKLYETWLQYQFESLGLSVKFGSIDLNTAFAYADNAGEFINSSMGFSPTIFMLPTYPDPSLGLLLAKSIGEKSTIALAINAGADRDDFSDKFYQLQWQYKLAELTLRIGAWHHDGVFSSLYDGQTNDGAEGSFFVAEGKLASYDLGYYVQYGHANHSVSEITDHVGIGLYKENTTIEGLSWGAGASTVKLSNALHTAKSSETAFELLLKYQLNDGVALKPDLQYIVSPAGDDRNELVATLRVEFGF